MYLVKDRKTGMMMQMYERYVDDSKQIAETVPPHTVYNVLTGKLVKDDNPRVDKTPEERTVIELLSIATSVQNSFIMEADHPGRDDNRKLEILDMKVWLDDDRMAVYQHNEKAVSNKQVEHAQSALCNSASANCTVHVNEITRRILNTSSKLDWNNQTAPILHWEDEEGRV